MAQFTSDQLAELRARLNANTATQSWTKPQVNAALQAIEDRLRLAATQNAIGSDIEAAAPGVFSAAQKQLLFGVWCYTAAKRLGVV
jgi:hypothetical protein